MTLDEEFIPYKVNVTIKDRTDYSGHFDRR